MTAPPQRILFVDDEADILDGLRNVLRTERARWDMRFALGGEEALRALAEASPDVVVTDMRMPGMDGLQLLERVQRGWPRCARIVLSGYADLAAVAQASSVAHQYLLKPCDPEVLRTVIERALELQALLGSDALRQTVGRIGTLPSTPRLYQELTRALANPDVEVKKLAAIVKQDPGMSARVLQFVNSAYFGLARKVTSIEEGIVFIGVSTLRHLALTLVVFEEFASGGVPPISAEALERHALLTARIARRIVADPARAEAAFAAGLLHDVGKLVLMKRLAREYHDVVARSCAERRPLHEVEREVFGADHAEVGAYLLGLWGLPLPIVEAVAFHHDRGRITKGVLGEVVAVGAADRLARAAAPDGLLRNEEEDHDRLDDVRAAWEQLAFDEAEAVQRRAEAT